MSRCDGPSAGHVLDEQPTVLVYVHNAEHRGTAPNKVNEPRARLSDASTPPIEKCTSLLHMVARHRQRLFATGPTMGNSKAHVGKRLKAAIGHWNVTHRMEVCFGTNCNESASYLLTCRFCDILIDPC